MELGNTSNVKWIAGIGEYAIDWGPAYRIYLAKEVRTMALTRDFKQTVVARVEREPAFARALLDEAANSLTRMGPAPGFGRPAPASFGMGSVGEFGSVGRGKTRRGRPPFQVSDL